MGKKRSKNKKRRKQKIKQPESEQLESFEATVQSSSEESEQEHAANESAAVASSSRPSEEVHSSSSPAINKVSQVEAVPGAEDSETLDRIVGNRSGVWTWFVPLALVLVVFTTYAASFGNPFVFDDAVVITHNVPIQKRDVLGVVLRSPSRSLTNLTFLANHILAETAFRPPFGSTLSYHLVNTMIHALNTILVFIFISQILGASYYRQQQELDPESRWHKLVALGAALLYATHPLQTMAVAYIAQRYALMAAFFVLATLVLYNTYRNHVEAGHSGRVQLPVFMAAVITTLCCFLAKENAAVVGFLVVLVEVFFWRGRCLGNALFFCLPFFYAVVVQGNIINDPAFKMTTSPVATLGLVVTLGGGLCLLVSKFNNLLPRRIFDLAGEEESTNRDAVSSSRVSSTKSHDEDDLENKLPTQTLWAIYSIAIGIMAVGVAMVVNTSGTLPETSLSIKLVSAFNMVVLLTIGLVIARVVTRDKSGLVPMATMVYFIVLWLIYINAQSTGAILDKLFPAPQSYNADHAHYQYLIAQVRALLYYPKLMFWPDSYSIEHNFPVPFYHKASGAFLFPDIYTQVGENIEVSVAWNNRYFLLSQVAHALVITLMVRAWNRSRLLSFAIAWYYCSLLISSSFIPILDVVVEHRTYLPMCLWSASVAVMILRGVGLCQRWLTNMGETSASKVTPETEEGADTFGAEAVRHFTVVIVLLAIFFGMRTQSRLKVWDSATGLWQEAIETYPNPRSFSSLGMEWLNQAGSIAAQKNEDAAIPYYINGVAAITASLEVSPGQVEGWNNLGKAYLELDRELEPGKQRHLDRLGLAEECFETGIHVGKLIASQYQRAPGPAVPLCYNNLALTQLRRSARFLPPQVRRPDVSAARTLLDKASENARQAYQIDPNYYVSEINHASILLRRAEVEASAQKRHDLAFEAYKILARVSRNGRSGATAFAAMLDAAVACGQGQEVATILAAYRVTKDKTLEGQQRAAKFYLDMLYSQAERGLERLTTIRKNLPGVPLARIEVKAVFELFETAKVQGHPRQIEINLGLATCHGFLGEFKDAVRLLDQAEANDKAKQFSDKINQLREQLLR